MDNNLPRAWESRRRMTVFERREHLEPSLTTRGDGAADLGAFIDSRGDANGMNVNVPRVAEGAMEKRQLNLAAMLFSASRCIACKEFNTISEEIA
jgi:hypothetical protein